MPNTVVGKGGVVRAGTAEELLQRARLKLLLGDLRQGKQGWGFFGQLAMYLTPRPMTPQEVAGFQARGLVPTLGTDGKELVYAREFIEDPQLTTNQRVFLWAHEAMHLALQHPWRGAPLARRAAALKGIEYNAAFHLTNVAADYVVNQILVENGMEPPKGALLDGRWSGKTMEQVFWDVVAEAEKHRNEQTLDNHMPPADSGKDKKDGKGDGKGDQKTQGGTGDQDGEGSGQPPAGSGRGKGKGKGKGRGQGSEDPAGQGQDSTDPNDAPLGQDLREIWEDRTRQAALSSAGRGNLPAEISRWVDELNNPTQPWQYLLARYLLEKSKSDYKWNPPNRRFVASGMYLPSMNSEKITLAVAVDTSGSIGQEQLTEFLSEVQGICNAFEDYAIYLIGCDAAVHDYIVLTPADNLLDQAFTGGGGGTNFAPVFERLAEEDVTPAVCVYLTDGDGWCQCDPPEYPVLWVISNDYEHALPFGEQIHMAGD